MALKNLNVRVDEDLKEQADCLFSELGMSMSTAINMFLRSAVRSSGFPCDLHLEPIPNKETQKAIEDMENGIGISKTFNSINELMEDLDA